MIEKEIIFKPDNLEMLLGLPLMPIFFSACLFITLTNPNSFSLYPGGFLLILFGILTLTLPLSLRNIPREIRFGNQIVIKRYIFSDLIIEYDDVLDMGSFTLITRQGKIALRRTKNIDRLHKIIKQLVQEKRIRLQGKLLREEALTWKSAFYAVIPSIIVYIAILIVKPKFLAGIDPFVIALIAFIVFWIFFEQVMFRSQDFD